MTTATEKKKSLAAIKTGVVIGNSRQKSCTVEVIVHFKHAKYGKLLKKATKYHVHDENNVTNVGDQVKIINCRPISKTKTWRLLEVVKVASN